MPESYAGKINRKLLKKQRIIAAAAGREPADLVLKNATFVNVFSNELSNMDIAVTEGLIVGMGSYHGRKSFDTFSHEKSILKKSAWIDMPVRYMPYTPLKTRLLRLFLR